MDDKTKQAILAKLRSGKSLTTADFASLALPFEAFLRYSQIGNARREEFHKGVLRRLEA